MSGEGTRVDRQKLLEIGSSCFGRAVRRTANLLTRTYNAFLAPVGIEVTQFSILCTIASAQAGSASELAEMVGVERSTLARNLDRLTAAGLVRAEAGEGRRVIHSLTAAGEERIAAALPLWQQAQDALQAQLKREQSDMIREDFRSLRRAARAVRPAA